MFLSQLGPDQRDSAISQLATEQFDILVIGGGVNGVGAALDAASRGLKVGLIEAQDIAVALYYLDTPEQEQALLAGYTSIKPLPKYSDNAMKALLLHRRLLLLNYLYETKNQEEKELLPAYLEKSLERVSTFLTDVTQ